jgi:hypothetical protein
MIEQNPSWAYRLRFLQRLVLDEEYKRLLLLRWSGIEAHSATQQSFEDRDGP